MHRSNHIDYLSPRLIWLMQLLSVMTCQQKKPAPSELSVRYWSLQWMTRHLMIISPARGSKLSLLRMTNTLDMSLSSLPVFPIPVSLSKGLQSTWFTDMGFHTTSSQTRDPLCSKRGMTMDTWHWDSLALLYIISPGRFWLIECCNSPLKTQQRGSLKNSTLQG